MLCDIRGPENLHFPPERTQNSLLDSSVCAFIKGPDSISHYLKPELHPNYSLHAIRLLP